MNRTLIVVLLAALGLTTSAPFGEPTGVSSTAPDVRTPAATASQADSRRMNVAETTIGGPSAQARIASDDAAGVDSGRSEAPARAHRNSQHPAVLSHSRPVYPIGVPLPPVSLERY
jgi:hypothetical protein